MVNFLQAFIFYEKFEIYSFVFIVFLLFGCPDKDPKPDSTFL